MADEGYFLTEQDLNAVQYIVNLVRQGRFNPTLQTHLRFIEDDEHMAPETYVARTPAGGIPAAGQATGTGTGLANEVGSAQCSIWYVIQEVHGTGTGTGTSTQPHPFLIQNVGFNKLIYNMSQQPIPGNVWVLVTRDKAGSWWVVSAQGGTGRILAQLTKKTYTPGQYTKYDWNFLVDQMPFDELVLGTSGIPAYHICGIDLPVPFQVYLNQGNGAYFLIEMVARWEIVRKSGPSGPSSYAPGFEQRYRQDSKQFEDEYQIVIIDANSLP